MKPLLDSLGEGIFLCRKRAECRDFRQRQVNTVAVEVPGMKEKDFDVCLKAAC